MCVTLVPMRQFLFCLCRGGNCTLEGPQIGISTANNNGRAVEMVDNVVKNVVVVVVVVADGEKNKNK